MMGPGAAVDVWAVAVEMKNERAMAAAAAPCSILLMVVCVFVTVFQVDLFHLYLDPQLIFQRCGRQKKAE